MEKNITIDLLVIRNKNWIIVRARTNWTGSIHLQTCLKKAHWLSCSEKVIFEQLPTIPQTHLQVTMRKVGRALQAISDMKIRNRWGQRRYFKINASELLIPVPLLKLMWRRSLAKLLELQRKRQNRLNSGIKIYLRIVNCRGNQAQAKKACKTRSHNYLR